jgi:hypothetical protein
VICVSIVISDAGAAAAAAAAAAKARKEEEELTKYNSDDLEGWEFKIFRSTLGRFKDYKVIKALCEKEARAGWEMVEKFDNYRIRFKRSTEHRANDRHLDFDPYRISMGVNKNLVLGLIAGGVLLLGIGVALLITFSQR